MHFRFKYKCVSLFTFYHILFTFNFLKCHIPIFNDCYQTLVIKQNMNYYRFIFNNTMPRKTRYIFFIYSVVSFFLQGIIFYVCLEHSQRSKKHYGIFFYPQTNNTEKSFLMFAKLCFLQFLVLYS